MSDAINHQVRLAARPVGLPKRSDFAFTESPLPSLEDGQVLIEVAYLSLDPAMRGWMNEGRSYIPPVELGAVMRAGGVGRVVESKAPGFSAGDWVSGGPGVQEFAALPAKGLIKIDTAKVPPTVWLNALGMPGMTAWFGLNDVGQAKAGETVVVSAAAGAVGATVGQIARQKGCRVVGIAGGPEKCAWLRELGFDAAVDYKAPDVKGALKQACPGGVDVYFDNVGGELLDLVLTRLNRHARVVICGAISQYNSAEGVTGPKNYLQLLVCRARMEGFVVFDYAPRYGEAVSAAGPVVRGGQAEVEGARRAGAGQLPRGAAQAVQGRELRQAGAPGGQLRKDVTALAQPGHHLRVSTPA